MADNNKKDQQPDVIDMVDIGGGVYVQAGQEFDRSEPEVVAEEPKVDAQEDKKDKKENRQKSTKTDFINDGADATYSVKDVDFVAGNEGTFSTSREAEIVDKVPEGAKDVTPASQNLDDSFHMSDFDKMPYDEAMKAIEARKASYDPNDPDGARVIAALDKKKIEMQDAAALKAANEDENALVVYGTNALVPVAAASTLPVEANSETGMVPYEQPGVPAVVDPDAGSNLPATVSSGAASYAEYPGIDLETIARRNGALQDVSTGSFLTTDKYGWQVMTLKGTGGSKLGYNERTGAIRMSTGRILESSGPTVSRKQADAATDIIYHQDKKYIAVDKFTGVRQQDLVQFHAAGQTVGWRNARHELDDTVGNPAARQAAEARAVAMLNGDLEVGTVGVKHNGRLFSPPDKMMKNMSVRVDDSTDPPKVYKSDENACDYVSRRKANEIKQLYMSLSEDAKAQVDLNKCLRANDCWNVPVGSGNPRHPNRNVLKGAATATPRQTPSEWARNKIASGQGMLNQYKR